MTQTKNSNLNEFNISQEKMAVLDSFKRDTKRRSMSMFAFAPAGIAMLVVAFSPQLKSHDLTYLVLLFILVVSGVISYLMMRKIDGNDRFRKLADFLNHNPEEETLKQVALVNTISDKTTFNVIVSEKQVFAFDKYLLCDSLYQDDPQVKTRPNASPLVKFVESEDVKIEVKKFVLDEQNQLTVYKVYLPKNHLNVVYADKA